MKRVLLVLFVTIVVTASTSTAAEYGTIGVFSEPTGCSCNVDDLVAGLVTVYVVHRDIVDGVEASRFIVRGDAGMTMTFVSESPIGGPIFITGNIVDGYDVFYGMCATGGLAIMTIDYFGLGTSAPCSRLEVVAAPTAVTGEVEVADCDGAVHAATGYWALVNADGSCACEWDPCTPVPVEETTWGGIKALYR
jgi:hypothetical protein